MSHSYKVQIVCLCASSSLDVILGSLFSQTFSALSNNLYRTLVPLNTSKHQSSMQLLCVCDVTYDRAWLIPIPWWVSYAAGLLNLHQPYACADTKNGKQSLSLDFSCSSVLSHLPQPGHHGAKQMFVHQNKWLGTGRQQTVSLANSAVNTLEWLQVQCHLSLCCCIMLSRAQTWLRVQAINDVMFLQQQVPSAKPCAQRGGQFQAPVNLPQVRTNSL